MCHSFWPNKAFFSQRLRRLREWTPGFKSLPEFMGKEIAQLRASAIPFRVAYDFLSAHRTSNLLDRLTQRTDRHLLNTQYFHVSLAAAEHSIRTWALI